MSTAGAGGVSLDRSAWFDFHDEIVVGGTLVEPAVGSVFVVVVDVLVQECSELSFVPDQGAIEEFLAEGADPAFGERVGHRRPWRGGDRGDARSGEHGVERSGVLAGAVVDQEPDLSVEAHEEVAGGLSGPRPSRVGGDPSEVHASRADLDEEQDVQAPERHGVDATEVGGDHCLGLGADKPSPARLAAVRGGVDAGGAEDLPHARRGNLVSEATEFAVDAPVSPGRVLACEVDREPADLGVARQVGSSDGRRGGGASRSRSRVSR